MIKRCNKCTSAEPEYDFCGIFEEYYTGEEDFAEECHAFVGKGGKDETGERNRASILYRRILLLVRTIRNFVRDCWADV